MIFLETPKELNNLISKVTSDFKEMGLVAPEIKIKVNYPLKKIANFVVVKQVTISFIDKNTISPYKLNLQLLSYKDKEDKIRVIWSRQGKFYINSDTTINRKLMKMVNTLISCFLDNNTLKDLYEPFDMFHEMELKASISDEKTTYTTYQDFNTFDDNIIKEENTIKDKIL